MRVEIRSECARCGRPIIIRADPPDFDDVLCSDCLEVSLEGRPSVQRSVWHQMAAETMRTEAQRTKLGVTRG